MTHEVRISRRQMLQVGGLGLTGISLPGLLRAEAESRATGIAPRADAAILIFLNYHLLGIQHDRLIHDHLGRPYRLVAKGDVTPPLIA